MPVALVAELARRQSAFESLAAYTSGPLLTVEAHGLLAWATTEFVDEKYYSVLGRRRRLAWLLREMRIPVLQGRDFAWSDDGGAPPVAVVNTLFARDSFGEESPIGRRIRVGGDPALQDVTIADPTDALRSE
jgi:hypothetical protein